MRSVRRMAGAASLLAALALVAAGCGGKFNDSSGSGSDGQDVPDASALDKASGVTKITFWHGNIKQT